MYYRVETPREATEYCELPQYASNWLFLQTCRICWSKIEHTSQSSLAKSKQTLQHHWVSTPQKPYGCHEAAALLISSSHGPLILSLSFNFQEYCCLWTNSVYNSGCPHEIPESTVPIAKMTFPCAALGNQTISTHQAIGAGTKLVASSTTVMHLFVLPGSSGAREQAGAC